MVVERLAVHSVVPAVIGCVERKLVGNRAVNRHLQAGLPPDVFGAARHPRPGRHFAKSCPVLHKPLTVAHAAENRAAVRRVPTGACADLGHRVILLFFHYLVQARLHLIHNGAELVQYQRRVSILEHLSTLVKCHFAGRARAGLHSSLCGFEVPQVALMQWWCWGGGAKVMSTGPTAPSSRCRVNS